MLNTNVHEALLEISPHQLEQQTAPLHQISQEMRARKMGRSIQTEHYQFFQSLASPNSERSALTMPYRSC